MWGGALAAHISLVKLTHRFGKTFSDVPGVESEKKKKKSDFYACQLHKRKKNVYIFFKIYICRYRMPEGACADIHCVPLMSITDVTLPQTIAYWSNSCFPEDEFQTCTD